MVLSGKSGLDPSVRTADGLVLDVDRFASHEGPGIRTAIFLKGCPLACAWCHSPESRVAQPQLLYRQQRCTGCGLCLDVCAPGALTITDGSSTARLDRAACEFGHGSAAPCVGVCYPGALSVAGRRMTVDDLLKIVEQDLPFYETSGGGVTLTGGEPAAQPDFSQALLRACRAMGAHTALQTTGHARSHDIRRLASEADLVMYDLKLLDDASHRKWTGVSNRLILSNLRRLAASHRHLLVRLPCIPGVTDAPERIRESARFVAGLGLKRIALLPYNGAAGAKYDWIGGDYALAQARTQSPVTMERLAEICRAEGLDVVIGGAT